MVINNNNHNKISIGYTENEIANPDDMLMYYSKEDIEKYGVLGIELKNRWITIIFHTEWLQGQTERFVSKLYTFAIGYGTRNRQDV